MCTSVVFGHILISLVAAPREGLAFVVPSAGRNQDRVWRSQALSLPQLSTQQVEDWLVRRNDLGQVLGGFQLASGRSGARLLQEWIRQAGTRGQRQPLAQPFHEAVDAVPESMGTLRQALRWMVECWRAEADVLSGGGGPQQEVASMLRRRLALPLGDFLDQGTLEDELSWFFYEAEQEWLLPQLSDLVMAPLRQWLTDLGFHHPRQSLTFLPLGRLAGLPLHLAEVPDPWSGRKIPFQETCCLTLG